MKSKKENQLNAGSACVRRFVRLVGLVLAWVGQWFDGLKDWAIRIGVQTCPKLLLKLCGGYLRFRDDDGSETVLRFYGVSGVKKSDNPVCRVITVADGNAKLFGRTAWVEASSEFIDDSDFDEDCPGLRVIKDVESFLWVARQFFGDHHCLRISEPNV